MLKIISGLFLGLVVLAGSACVTPTHASSAQSVIIRYVQASGAGGAKEELVVLHNNSSVEVEITDWCLSNKSQILFACFVSQHDDMPGELIRSFLPPYGDITIASEEFSVRANAMLGPLSLIYPVTNQSSGSIVNGGDTVQLINSQGEVIDENAWTSSIPAGKAWSRVLLLPTPAVYAATGNTSDWVVGPQAEPPDNMLEQRFELVEPPEPTDPVDPVEGEPGIPLDVAVPILTEILPNPAGSDTGSEFIELYNPSATDSVVLSNFKLRIGTDSPKWYEFPDGAIIQPMQYLALYNRDLDFTLLNTTSAIQLFYGDIEAGDAVAYSSPKDDQAWALLGDTWQYTSIATPAAENRVVIAEITAADDDDAPTVQKPCASNQFRNPETGRCKLIAAAESTQTPCKEGQERNAETNRCRSIAAAQSTQAPCKEGQERNPETNRCRNIVKMSSADHAVKGVQTQAGNQPSWYYIGAIALIIAAILAYAVWEWRQELKDVWLRLRRRFAK